MQPERLASQRVVLTNEVPKPIQLCVSSDSTFLLSHFRVLGHGESKNRRTEGSKNASGTTEVKIRGRKAQRMARRAAIARIRRNLLAITGREPTIAEVQWRLAPLGLNASVRTVWKELLMIRPTARQLLPAVIKVAR